MKRAGKKLGGLVLALVVAVSSFVAVPMTASAANEIQAGQPTIAVNSTEVVFAGHTWVVVADKGGAFGINTGTTDGNSVTLLLKNGDTGFSGYTQAFFYSFDGTNIYTAGQLNQAMQGIYSAIGTTSNLEQGLIKGRLLDRVAVNNPGQFETMITEEYVWPLSDNEYAAIGSAQAYGSHWWLRSPYFGNPASGLVGLSGGGGPLNVVVDYFVFAVRPALNLNLSSVIFTSAAVGGKPGTAGQTLTQAAALPASGALKFTMQDAGLSLTRDLMCGPRR